MRSPSKSSGPGTGGAKAGPAPAGACLRRLLLFAVGVGRRLALGAMLLCFHPLSAGRAGPIELPRRAITLPAGAGEPLFVDIDGDGRLDLVVLDQVENRLLNYHQHPDGFSDSPDQAIPLPPQTAWVALCDVDAHAGLELLCSTATGLVYSRQNGGLFELERRVLISANQVFTNYDQPLLTLLTTNPAEPNSLIPVITAGQTVLYHRNSAYEWSPEPPQALHVKQTDWLIDRNPQLGPWTLGPNPARNLRAQQSFWTKPEPQRAEAPENESIRNILDDMKKREPPSPPHLQRIDVNGDGREDLVLWQVNIRLDFRTDLYVFLRGADDQLPARPTQVLHCNGMPFPIGSLYEWSPVSDLNGEGRCELVLLEPKTVLASSSGVVEMFLSHGVDWTITIRAFHDGAFSRAADAAVAATTILAMEELSGWPIRIHGDFNGDGRPDLLVRRSETRWNIFFSTSDRRWFAAQPALTFEAPARGYAELIDLNGDGLTDIVWHEFDAHRLSLYRTPAGSGKGPNR